MMMSYKLVILQIVQGMRGKHSVNTFSTIPLTEILSPLSPSFSISLLCLCFLLLSSQYSSDIPEYYSTETVICITRSILSNRTKQPLKMCFALKQEKKAFFVANPNSSFQMASISSQI